MASDFCQRVFAMDLVQVDPKRLPQLLQHSIPGTECSLEVNPIQSLSYSLHWGDLCDFEMPPMPMEVDIAYMEGLGNWMKLFMSIQSRLLRWPGKRLDRDWSDLLTPNLPGFLGHIYTI